MRPRCACWGQGDITSWSERGAECGQKALSPGKPYGQVSQQPLGFLQDPIKAGEVGQGGEVGLQGGLGGQVALGQVLALQQEKDGQGQEFGQGGFLVPLLFGELEPLGL